MEDISPETGSYKKLLLECPAKWCTYRDDQIKIPQHRTEHFYGLLACATCPFEADPVTMQKHIEQAGARHEVKMTSITVCTACLAFTKYIDFEDHLRSCPGPEVHDRQGNLQKTMLMAFVNVNRGIAAVGDRVAELREDIKRSQRGPLLVSRTSDNGRQTAQGRNTKIDPSVPMWFSGATWNTTASSGQGIQGRTTTVTPPVPTWFSGAKSETTTSSRQGVQEGITTISPPFPAGVSDLMGVDPLHLSAASPCTTGYNVGNNPSQFSKPEHETWDFSSGQLYTRSSNIAGHKLYAQGRSMGANGSSYQ